MIGFARFAVARRAAVLVLAGSLALALAAVALAGLPAVQLPTAQGTDRARSLSRRASERIRALQQEAEALAREERTLLGELRRLELERETYAQELVSIEQNARALDLEQQQVVARRAALEQDATRQRPQLDARLVELYKLGRGGYLRLLLGVDDARNLGRAYRAIAHLAHADRARAAAYRATIDELQATERALDERRAALGALSVEAQRARAAAAEALTRRNALVADIDRRRDLMAEYIGELEMAHRKIQALLAPAPAGSAADPAGAGAADLSLPLRPFQGDLSWPAEGRLTSRFGTQRNARFGTSTYRSGIGIGAPPGSPVRAVHGGLVAFAEPFTGFGTLVIVDHGREAFSLYGHLESALVARGARVTAGQVVGTVGRAPMGTPELYFELRIDGRPVDPVQWLRKR